jgi:hypothetical protein
MGQKEYGGGPLRGDVFGRRIGPGRMACPQWSCPGLAAVIRKEDLARSSMRPSKPGAACGRAVTSSRGYIEFASEPAVDRLNVRMTRMPTLECRTDRAAA